MHPRRPKMASRLPKTAQKARKRPPRRPKSPPRRPPGRPERAKIIDFPLVFEGFVAFSSFQLSDGPRRPKRPPTSPLERPRGLQDGPMTAQEAPKMAPRGPQDGPRRRVQKLTKSPSANMSDTFALGLFEAFLNIFLDFLKALNIFSFPISF